MAIAAPNPGIPDKVLILDDQHFDRSRLARLCGSLSRNISITQVESLAMLPKALATNCFDLAFLDYDLPDGTGLQAFEMIKKSTCNALTPAIMVSDNSDPMIAETASSAGIARLLSKSELTTNTLRRAVQDVLATFNQNVGFEHAKKVQENVKAADSVLQMKSILQKMLRHIRRLKHLNELAPSAQKTVQIEIERSCLSLLDHLADLERTGHPVVPAHSLHKSDEGYRNHPH